MSEAGFDPAIVERATKAQSAAADPGTCVFVEANAGSGKTRVLVDRVARLLLAGARPDRILCVTFTKAAAGEMQARLFRKLGDWSTLPDEALRDELNTLTGGAGAGDLAMARRLFARALETPGGLKIQTLHAFCESLLRRFPLEAGLPPGFEVQDDAHAAAVRAECLDALYGAAHREPGGALADAIATVLAQAGPDGVSDLAGFVLNRRHAFARALADAGSAEALADRASLALGVDPEIDEDAAYDIAWMETEMSDLDAALSGLQAGAAKTDANSAAALHAVLEAGERDAAEAAKAYIEFWLTGTGTLKKPGSIFTKKTGETYRILVTLFGEEGSERHRMDSEVLPLVAAGKANQATRAGILLASRLLTDYEARLARRRKVDFSDLVDRAAGLLTAADSREWTRYKLDQGLDHVLVDEAQDTAPEQWAVINALTEEFFAGEGARDAVADGLARSVFCVGDEKQSIYSFQNADPAEFLRQREKLEHDAVGADLRFDSPGLDVSFRSAAEVLSAVDAAFTAEAAALHPQAGFEDGPSELETKFLMADPETAEARDALPFHRYDGHKAARAHAPGCVEIWPAVPKPEKPEADVLEFDPVDAPRKDSARNQLAEAVTSEIARIIKDGDGVWEEGKPWRKRAARPGDILVLVRKRGGLFEEIIRRLKLKRVAVAGADRMTLPDQLVVEDLLSLAKWALLPEDDLSLAEILKSPFFQQAGSGAPVIDDDALFALSQRPGRRLWEKLRHFDDPRFAEAREALERARARVETEPPYGFFARFLGEASSTGENRLKRLYARLGEEARDPAEEFLSRALAHEREGAPSLARFAQAVEADSADVKREMEAGRNEVRVMTVHGAKGLEAPIVFLPDTTQTARDRSGGLFAHPAAGLIWNPDTKKLSDLAQSLKSKADLAAEGEYQRLLYVAMTRARDRLVICGHTHGNGGKIDAGCWYDRADRTFTGEGWREIRTALDAQAEENGWDAPPGRRFGPDPERLGPDEARAAPAAALPGWALTPPAPEPCAPRAAAPSKLLGEEESGFEPAPLSPLAESGPDRFRRGSIIHKLLQTLPDLPQERRRGSAERYLAAQLDLSEAQKAEIVEETLRVLSDPQFSAIFGPGSRAEVSVSGRAPGLPEGMIVNGQIDRLVITDQEILIIDFKTNRPPPERSEDVSPVYYAQMAAYRALLKAIHPGKPVRCALLWTDAPRLMELPEDRLDGVLARARANGGA
ncbi:MAG: UvrD-helicase domain-containing protein [Alphaproteobacteria bacterium]|nr:UvrD-helicase domain-containing protein [Alphaproteobacteria bacterium]